MHIQNYANVKKKKKKKKKKIKLKKKKKKKKNTNTFITMIICRNNMILLIIQFQCYYISSLKQYKTLGSLSTVFQYFNLLSSYWKPLLKGYPSNIIRITERLFLFH